MTPTPAVRRSCRFLAKEWTGRGSRFRRGAPRDQDDAPSERIGDGERHLSDCRFAHLYREPGIPAARRHRGGSIHDQPRRYHDGVGLSPHGDKVVPDLKPECAVSGVLARPHLSALQHIAVEPSRHGSVGGMFAMLARDSRARCDSLISGSRHGVRAVRTAMKHTLLLHSHVVKALHRAYDIKTGLLRRM